MLINNDYAKVVINDTAKKKAIYILANIKLKGFVSDHSVKGLYWFNTEEGMAENKRDLLVSASEVKVLV